MHVLITGGSRGIGAATARLCAARGWDVTVNYVANAEAAAAVVAEVEAAGARAVAVQADMGEIGAAEALFDAAEAALGPVTGFVNNAGIVAKASMLAEMEPARIKRMIDVNVTGAILALREAARRMPLDRGGPGGSIVNISSAAARLGSPATYVDYAASKGAIDTLTLGMAQELARGEVRVNCVRPGIVETDIHLDSHGFDRAAQAGPSLPMGRAGRAGEIAEAIVWLLSDAASYTSGALLDVAGAR
ncbi:MAG: SDR family NAD(P)-dependent oxidoreductase [Albimonas sp.]|uniref:SDR family NAD(P)-dependent oxidoreductase n=1 Tax=Albimonas sp. TaxID=1872425 RepID=UPI0040576AAD